MPVSTMESNGGGIRFVLDGKVLAVDDVDPTQSVLGFLRERLGRTGTKEGCAEGDCGACTVVVGELAGEDVALHAVNACIQFLPTLDGKALFTVEDLRRPDGSAAPGAAGDGRLPRLAVRLLHAGLRDVALGALPRSPGAADPPDRRRDTKRAHRQPLPLHRVSTDPRCGCTDVRPRARAFRPRRIAAPAAGDPAGSLARPRARRSRVFRAAIDGGIDRVAGKPSAGDHSRGQYRRRPLGQQAAARSAGDHLHRVHRRAQGDTRRRRRTAHRRRGHAHRSLPRAGAALSGGARDGGALRLAPDPQCGNHGRQRRERVPDRRFDARVDRIGSHGDAAQPRRVADAADGGSVRRVHEESDGGGRNTRSHRGAAAEASAALSDVQGVEAPRLRHLGRLRGVRHRARGGSHRALPCGLRRSRRHAEARCRHRAGARREALDRGHGAGGDGRARNRLHAVDRHAGERGISHPDRAESAVSLLSRDATAQSVAGDRR